MSCFNRRGAASDPFDSIFSHPRRIWPTEWADVSRVLNRDSAEYLLAAAFELAAPAESREDWRILEPPPLGERPGLRVMERSPEVVFDELLVLEAQGGDARAFEQLVERWQPRVLRHAMELTGRHDLAADVAQESWIAAAKGLRRLDDPACFPRWLLRIVSHKSTDAIRDLQRRRKLVEQVAVEAPHATEPTGRDASDDASALRRAIASLPGDRRALVSMFYWDELSIAEIAHVMNVPPGTVKSRLHHVRQELKQFLERSQP